MKHLTPWKILERSAWASGPARCFLHAIRWKRNLGHSAWASGSQGGPKTHPKLVKSSFGAPRCPRKCPCDLWMTKKLIQDTRKEPPSPQRDTSEYRKVIPTRIPNALKCENRIMTSKLRNFEVEETLNRDFNLKVILSNRQPFNPISKSKKR